MDGPGHARGGPGQALADEPEDRLPGAVEDVRLRRPPRGLRGERDRLRRVRAHALAPQGGQAPRPRRVADDAADRERVLRPVAQRDGVPRRHPPAPVLRQGLLQRGELRRHRRHDGARADARLRRRGQPVRRRGQPAQLVERADRQAVQGPDEVRDRPVRRLRGRARGEAERRADGGREHRRHRRAQARARRLPREARRASPTGSWPTATPRIRSSSSRTGSRGARKSGRSTWSWSRRPTRTRPRATA